MNRIELSFTVLTFACASLFMGAPADNGNAASFVKWVNPDTASFVANQTDGWAAPSTYLSMLGADSARLEVLIQHANNINWNEEHIIGEITDGGYRPAANLEIDYALLSNSVWKLRITTDGKCYLKLVQGIAPPDDPAIFPVNINYKIR